MPSDVPGAGPIGVQPSAESEVAQVDVVGVADEDVGGLHVAVHQPSLVGGIERRRHLRADTDRPLRRQRPVGQQLPKVAALDVAHGEVQRVLELPGRVHRHHVRMFERRHRARLLQEPLPERLVQRQLRGDQLQRHVAVEGRVEHAVDDAHTAAADQRLDLVAEHRAADAKLASCHQLTILSCKWCAG